MRDFRFSIKDNFEVAAATVGIAGWEGYRWQMVSGGAIVHGCVPSGVYQRGAKKGLPKFRPATPGTERQVVVTEAQLRDRAIAYEAVTGDCWDCKGTGQEWCGWSATDGHKHRTCVRCKGDGKAIPATPASGG